MSGSKWDRERDESADRVGSCGDAWRRLEEENRYLSAIIEHIPDMVFIRDVELRHVGLNAAGEALLGLSKAELIGRRVDELFPAEQAAYFNETDREALETGRVVEIAEEPIETARGLRWIATKKVPIAGADGRPKWLVGIAEDITARRRADELVARLAAIVESSEDAIIGRDLDGVITSWNKAAERIFGYAAEEVVGKPDPSFALLDREDAGLLSIAQNGKQVLTRRRRKDGREIQISKVVSPIFDRSGRKIGTSVVARDVTEARRIVDELARAKQTAEEANRELESFSYSVAHDLRAPLRSIDGFSQALVEDFGDVLDEEGRRFLGFIRSSAQRMAMLIDDLLALSRVTRAELRREPVDLSALALAVVSRLRAAEPDRRVDVSIQGGLRGHGDPRLLAVALENLVGNAWKFTSRRDVARIEFGATATEEGPVYFVRDDGAGFDMAFVDKLFGVFQRLHAATDFVGTGVGLATVQRIVRRHDGRIWAEGAIDRGATFYFTLGHRETT